jgi:hypothetical protein
MPHEQEGIQVQIQDSQHQIPPTVEAFQRRWQVKFKPEQGGFYLRGDVGLISTICGRLYFSCTWLDDPFIRQLKELGFKQVQEQCLKEWYFPDNAYTTASEDAGAVSLAFQIIGKTPNQKTRKAILAAIRNDDSTEP